MVILHGNDEFQVDQQAREVLKRAHPNAGENGSLTVIRGDVDTVDQALQAIRETLTAVQSLNMFSPENVTWLREVTFLSGAVFKSEDVKTSVEKLQDTLSRGLGPEQFLLMTVSGKLDARSRFLKAVSKVAELRDYSKSTKEWELQKESLEQLRAALAERGVSAEPRALEEMALRVGPDTRLMTQEVEKLDLYLGGERKLRLKDVQWMVGARQEAQVYQLGDCIASRDLTRAMAMLRQMETQGLSPIGVIATLHNALREMAYLRALIQQGAARVQSDGRFGKLVYQDEEAREGFQRVVGDKKRSPFRQFQLGRQSMAFTPGQMDHMLRLSARTYDRMFRASLSQYDLLRVLMLSIFHDCIKKSA